MLKVLFCVFCLIYFGIQLLFIAALAAIFAIALIRIARGKDRASTNETVPVGENVLAVKEHKGRKEVFS